MAKGLGPTKASSYILEQLKLLIESPDTDAAFKLKCINQMVKVEAKRKPKAPYKPRKKPTQEALPSPRLAQIIENMGRKQ